MEYGFIGCGNMGGAIAKALSKNIKDIMLSDFVAEKASNLACELGCAVGDNGQVFTSCKSVFLGTKPQVLANMLKNSLAEIKNSDPILISMAAGVSIGEIEEILGYKPRIIRIMPNMPVAVGKGMILYASNGRITQEEKEKFCLDMSSAGVVDELDEKLIDAGCALSGCGPAYMYMMIEALADGGVACGLPRDKAIKYASATMSGAAETVLAQMGHPEVLKDKVCSPGGTTIAGVSALEENGFRNACIQAVLKGYEKSKNMSK